MRPLSPHAGGGLFGRVDVGWVNIMISSHGELASSLGTALCCAELAP